MRLVSCSINFRISGNRGYDSNRVLCQDHEKTKGKNNAWLLRTSVPTPTIVRYYCLF